MSMAAFLYIIALCICATSHAISYVVELCMIYESTMGISFHHQRLQPGRLLISRLGMTEAANCRLTYLLLPHLTTLLCNILRY